MRREIKIGIFLAGTFLILAAFIFIVGDMSDLVSESRVMTSLSFSYGYRAGKARRRQGWPGSRSAMSRISGWIERKARVVLAIWPKYQVPKGSRRRWLRSGSSGRRYIEISPSEQAEFLKPGETIEASAGHRLRPDRRPGRINRR